MRQKHILKLQINVVSTEDGKMPWGYWLITVDLINEAIACWSQSARYASVGWAQGGELFQILKDDAVKVLHSVSQ